jgi:phytoene dehydrogenase-like protein
VPPRVIVVGGGHNGLVCAAYLARGGVDVTVLERRDLVGGACVGETLWPGYCVSRAAYVVSLLRPCIVRDLGLHQLGVELLPRTPSSFTPLADGRSLLLGRDLAQNLAEIRRFSTRDAERFASYEAFLERVASAFDTLLDLPPATWPVRSRRAMLAWVYALRAGLSLGRELPEATRALLAPARTLLEEWFESEPLRATLATDAAIGAFAAPSTPGTGYVLFHHVMGSAGGARGVWAYVRGGMGALSEALASAAKRAGASVRTGASVAQIRVRDGRAAGVVLENGEELAADAVACSTDLARMFTLLDEPSALPPAFVRALQRIDYRSPVFKLNLALGTLPRFRANGRDDSALRGTIHVGTPDLDSIERAHADARDGKLSERPLVELTIPSTLDPTLAPAGKHVASVFAQYAPALDASDARWPALRAQMLQRVVALVEEVAPGFAAAIEHAEVLAAPDLESIFGLTGGNIFHGAMTPDRLYFMRPVPGFTEYRLPLADLYLCGSAAHPGGGVMGAPGRNAALEMLADLRRRRGSRDPETRRARRVASPFS